MLHVASETPGDLALAAPTPALGDAGLSGIFDAPRSGEAAEGLVR